MTDQVTATKADLPPVEPALGDIRGYAETAEMFMGADVMDWVPYPFAQQREFGHRAANRRVFEQDGSWARFLNWIDIQARNEQMNPNGDPHP